MRLQILGILILLVSLFYGGRVASGETPAASAVAAERTVGGEALELPPQSLDQSLGL